MVRRTINKVKQHVKKVKARLDASKKFHTVKRHVKRIYGIWQAIVLLGISIVLIPVFLNQGLEHSIYSWLVPVSILLYLIITLIHFKLKPGFVKRYLETTATQLLLGTVALAAAFIFRALGIFLWAEVLLCVAAVLYAAFLQQISFLKVIGL